MTDFGLSAVIGHEPKKGGTPIYSNERVFMGLGQKNGIDFYAYNRLQLYLCLEWKDFIQLCCFPIENKTTRKIIRNGIRSFDIIKEILKGLKYGNETSYKTNFDDLSSYSKVKISRHDLISSGIPADWFIDSLPFGPQDAIQLENFGLQNLK